MTVCRGSVGGFGEISNRLAHSAYVAGHPRLVSISCGHSDVVLSSFNCLWTVLADHGGDHGFLFRSQGFALDLQQSDAE